MRRGVRLGKSSLATRARLKSDFASCGGGKYVHAVRKTLRYWTPFGTHIAVEWWCGNSTTSAVYLHEGPATCPACVKHIVRKVVAKRRPRRVEARYVGWVGGVIADQLRD